MQEIIFPGINLHIQISKIAFTILGINIYWYGILIVIGIIIAILLCKKDDGKYGIKFKDVLDLFIYVLPISILCARIYYVVFSWEQYQQNPIQIFDLRSGGIAIYGAIIGGVITSILFCKKRGIHIIDLLEYIVPYLALGQAIGRWGNFVNVEAYGTTTNLPWRMGIVENGIYKEVHPAFLYESLVTFVIFLILFCLRNRRKYKGQLLIIYCLIYSFARIFIENIRIDSLMLQNVRISQILSIVVFVVTCLIIISNVVKKRKRKNNEKKCGEKIR